jgi:undecaprenyl pyrophosphate synthase
MALFREQIAMYSAPGGFAEQLDFSIRVLGRLEMLDEKTRDAVEKAVEATRKGKLILNLCVIIHVARRDDKSHATVRG